MLNYFANPNRFLKFANVIQPWIAWLTIILFSMGLFLGLFNSPVDYQQGETVRIMYVHVPSAWMALFCYTGLSISCAIALIWKHPLAELVAKATAPIGASFTVLALVTGSLWGKPMWGTWWVWDARLTSMVILLFLYLGYIALNNAFENPQRGAKSSSILAIVGFVNVPIIKFSVDWWNTLHQPASVIKIGGPAIHPSILEPLLIMGLAFTTYYLWVLLIRIKRLIIINKIRALQIRQALGEKK